MKVKDLLNIPRRWIKWQMAKRDDGEVCSPTDPLAVCFCLRGGFDRCYPTEGPAREAASKRLNAAIALVNGPHGELTEFNDDPATDHPRLMRVLELADV